MTPLDMAAAIYGARRHLKRTLGGSRYAAAVGPWRIVLPKLAAEHGENVAGAALRVLTGMRDAGLHATAYTPVMAALADLSDGVRA